ncbi:MAG: Clp1/GlmU family protein [Candidatus Bathycorpusculaceae bacterium]
MNRTVDNGKTLLVDGPASVAVTSGKAEVFGSVLGGSSKVVIREGKRLPFTVMEKASFQISLGENASVEEVDGNTIPPSWNKSYEELVKLDKKPVTAIVSGTVDSGKTSFCTYLVNNLLREKRKLAVLDGDLGQSDIGPPCTVAYTFVTKPLTDLFNLELENAFFVGVTSPSAAINKVIEGLVTLKRQILEDNPDFIVVNTDGWVEGEDAVNYKARLVEELNPDVVFCIQQKDELAHLLNALEKFKKVIVESPMAIRQRSREKRKSLRELGYIKHLKNAKVQSFPISWLKIEDDWLLGLDKAPGNVRRARKVYELLGMKPLHFAELPDKICIVIGRGRWVNRDNIKKIEEFTKKKVVIVRKGEEAGLLTALYDQKRKFLGIGILYEVDFLRKTLKIYTSVSENVSAVAFGRVKLGKNMKEIPVFAEEEPLEFTALK